MLSKFGLQIYEWDFDIKTPSRKFIENKLPVGQGVLEHVDLNNARDYQMVLVELK